MTGVDDLDRHIIAIRQIGIVRNPRIASGNVAGADGQRSTVGHGVSRIDGEVDDDLLKLALVNLHEAGVSAMSDLEIRSSTDQATQQVRELR